MSESNATFTRMRERIAELEVGEETFKESIRRNMKRSEKAEAELATKEDRIEDLVSERDETMEENTQLKWAITQWHAEEDDWVRDRAALEAEAEAIGTELTVSKRLNAKWMDSQTAAIMDKEQAEAELAALKARRCWTCRHRITLSHGGNAYGYPECPLYGNDFEADGFCHHWEART